VIEELHIRSLGVIDATSLILGPGLTVVTGETGAGKTMLVTALELLLGARASTDLVRSGSDAAVVEALVRVPAARAGRTDAGDVAGDVAGDEAGDEAGDGAMDGPGEDLWDLAEDGVLIVSREIPATGRSRARVGGRLVPVTTLARLLAPHIEVHGQHEHIRLEQPGVQRRLLDAFAGADHAGVLEEFRAAHLTWSTLKRRRRALEEDATARARRLDQLRTELEEIDSAALDVDVDGLIDQEIDRLANADALRAAVEVAHTAAGPNGALDGLGQAITALRRAPVADATVVALSERLAGVSRELSEVAADLAGLVADIEADDARLDRLQSRKRELTGLMRRYGATVEAILAHRHDVAGAIEELVALEADAGSIDRSLELASAALTEVGGRLTASRRGAGERLRGLVDAHLAELGLEHARLHVRMTQEPAPTPDGLDRIDVLLAANPGEPPARLADGASGGERSRVALALEVVLASGDDRAVLVFDEVDAGIGGSTALAVGAKLSRLARDVERPRQVLCVTHLAQVAAFADQHHVVEKSVRDGRTVTSVRRVGDDARVEELSRMLGGEATAEAGLAHARGLLDAARARTGS
jgi:DNA repair protein RecN (Recombination protein N)